jgi:hypothetical protein
VTLTRAALIAALVLLILLLAAVGWTTDAIRACVRTVANRRFRSSHGPLDSREEI